MVKCNNEILVQAFGDVVVKSVGMDGVRRIKSNPICFVKRTRMQFMGLVMLLLFQQEEESRTHYHAYLSSSTN